MSDRPSPAVRQLRARDGVRLAIEHRSPARPEMDVVLVHGYGEHQGRYAHVVDALVGAGASVWTFDLRGHGRAGGIGTRTGHSPVTSTWSSSGPPSKLPRRVRSCSSVTAWAA